MIRLPAVRSRQHSRGQSLVEFAMVLPIILLLTLVALDFGRVYLGYINLQSMARIAANFAANNPDAWATGDTKAQTKYKNQIVADAAATNCTLPTVAGITSVPTPTFVDTNGDGTMNGLGDAVKVDINCTFGVITPIISNILGGSVAVSAESNFPVKSGMTAFDGGATGPAPNAAFIANGVEATIPAAIGVPDVTISGSAPFDVDFRDTSGGAPTSWSWTLGDGATSLVQDPFVHTYAAGTYTVTMTATNAAGSSTAMMKVVVNAASAVDFTANPGSGSTGMTVTFTSTSTPGGTAYAWTFGSGEGTGTGATTTHTYNSAGTYTVSLKVTYPSPTGAITNTKTDLITVALPLCEVPDLFNVVFSAAGNPNGAWATAGFDKSKLSAGPGNPNANGNNWQIKTQTLTGHSFVPCTASIQVNDH